MVEPWNSDRDAYLFLSLLASSDAAVQLLTVPRTHITSTQCPQSARLSLTVLVTTWPQVSYPSSRQPDHDTVRANVGVYVADSNLGQ